MNPPGFRPGHDVNGDTGLGGGVGDSGCGVALVHPDVGDGRRDPFGAAHELRERGAVLCVGRGYDGRDEDSGAVDQHVAFDAVDLLGAVEPARPGDRGCLDQGRIDHGRRGPRRRPDRVRTSSRIAVSTLVQVPARHQRRKCLCAADQLTVKSCGRCRHAHPVGSTYRMASRYSRQRSGGPGPPAVRMVGHDESGDACPGGIGQVGSIPAPSLRGRVT